MLPNPCESQPQLKVELLAVETPDFLGLNVGWLPLSRQAQEVADEFLMKRRKSLDGGWQNLVPGGEEHDEIYHAADARSLIGTGLCISSSSNSLAVT